MDNAPNEHTDRVARLACHVLDAPMSMVSIVDGGSHSIASDCDLRDRPLPISGARAGVAPFQERVVAYADPLIVPDALADPTLYDDPIVVLKQAAAVVAIPLQVASHGPMGTLSVLDTKPRDWTADELRQLGELASLIGPQIELRDLLRVSTAGEARFRLILDAAGEGIYGLDLEGRCTFANPQCARLLGYDHPAELLGKPMHDLIHHSRADGRHYPVSDCPIVRALEKGEGAHVDDEVYWRRDGSAFAAEYRSQAVVVGGFTVGAVVSFSDITERVIEEEKREEALEEAEVRRARAERADMEKSRFLTNMSHEIRTPMNAILGFSELLEGLVESPKAKRYLEAIRSSGSALLSLINDILDLSKVESGALVLNTESTNIRAMVESVRVLFAQKAAEQNLEFTVTVNDAVPDFLIVDRLRIRQVLINIVNNAVKFTDNGSVSLDVDIDAGGSTETRATLVMRVADTGIGIAEADLDRVFKPFEQVGERAGQVESGTGLGLSICRKIVELSGGTITVTSEAGSGSTFVVRLPNLELSTKPVTHEILARADVDIGRLAPSDILVADDNQLNRDLLAGYFDQTDHRLRFAADGEAVVAMAKEKRPDVILMDIRMPKMTGLQARKAIVESGELAEVPIVAVTASSMLQQERQLRRIFDGFIRKPFSYTQLFQELARFLPERNQGLVDQVAPAALALEPDEASREKWGEAVGKLQRLRDTTWATVSETMAMGEARAFARALRDIAKEAGCAPLEAYGATLQEEVESFQLSKIEASLRAFPDIVETISAQLRDRNA